MYTPLEMSNFVKNVFTQTPVYDIDHRIQEEGSIYNPVDGFVENLILVAEFVGWKKLTLISLTNFEFPYLMYFRKTVKALQRMKVCLEFYHIDPQMDMNEIEFVKRIPNTEQINVVILFGSWWHQENFLNKIFAIFGRLPFFPVINKGYLPQFIKINGSDYLKDQLKIDNQLLEIYDEYGKKIAELQSKGHFPTTKYNALPEYLQMGAAENTHLYHQQLKFGTSLLTKVLF